MWLDFDVRDNRRCTFSLEEVWLMDSYFSRKQLFEVKWKWRDIWPSIWWPILGIRALHLTQPKCTHTAVNSHTPWTRTRSSGQPFMLRRPGSSWGFGALLKGTSVVVLRVERALYIHCPHRQFLPAQDSNSQPLDYESDSLTIRPQLDGFISKKHAAFVFSRC